LTGARREKTICLDPRLVSGPVRAKYGDTEVASIEKDYSRADRTKPYLELHGRPVPKE
jgi:hypothetical protein